MAIEGVLTRRECADKWCATLWAPGPQFSVSPNSQIFNLHDFPFKFLVAFARVPIGRLGIGLPGTHKSRHLLVNLEKTGFS